MTGLGWGRVRFLSCNPRKQDRESVKYVLSLVVSTVVVFLYGCFRRVSIYDDNNIPKYSPKTPQNAAHTSQRTVPIRLSDTGIDEAEEQEKGRKKRGIGGAQKNPPKKPQKKTGLLSPGLDLGLGPHGLEVPSEVVQAQLGLRIDPVHPCPCAHRPPAPQPATGSTAFPPSSEGSAGVCPSRHVAATGEKKGKPLRRLEPGVPLPTMYAPCCPV